MGGQQEQGGIVSGGLRNLERAPQEKRRADLLVQYQQQLTSAGFIRRLVILWRISREARRVREAEAPPHALYVLRQRGS